MCITDRLKKLIEVKGKSIASMAKELGLPQKTFSNYFNLERSPSFETLEAILNTYQDISAEWLVLGKGNMMNSVDRPIAHSVKVGEKGIPLIPLSAMAGALTGEQNVMDYNCEHYVVPAFKGADFLIPVKGVSMFPHYQSGDIVACQRVPMGDLFFEWNQVYVLDTKQGPLIKRVKPGNDKDHVLIVSDNEEYDPFELPVEAINAVARVIGVIRLE